MLQYFNVSYLSLDVITIERTGENFRLIYDVKGRFAVHRITPEEAKVIISNLRTSRSLSRLALLLFLSKSNKIEVDNRISSERQKSV